MKGNKKLFKYSTATGASLSLMVMLTPLSFADSMGSMGSMPSASTSSAPAPAAAGQQWTMLVGGATSDQAFQAMSFFPNVMTIDAGDTVNFKFTGDHTVSFAGSDGKFPSTVTPGWDKPAGGNSYDGATLTSSGMLMAGNTYSLNFTKPGIYTYHCLMHPGMQGVIIVQPSGTAYPMTQSQYDTLAAQESQADLTAAQNAASSFQNASKPGPDGTTVWEVQSDLPEPLTYSLNLSSQNNSGVSGTTTLSMAKPGTWNIELKLAGLTPGKNYSPALDAGKSDSGAAVAGSQINSFTAASDGTADVTGTVQALAIPQGIWFVDVNDSSGSAVASGIVNYLSFSDERFLPETLNIHVGDTVVWKQWGGNEAHTISFLPSNWSDVPNEGLMYTPTGGATYSGEGYFNSGLLLPGQSYTLTFDNAGNYQYRCLLHDMMGMYGKVNVLPSNGVIVNIDGQGLDSDQTAFLSNDHTLVPLRKVFETLGAQVAWNDATQTATATKGNTTVVVDLGSRTVKINGQTAALNEAPQLINDHVFVPVQILAQAFGYKVSWDQSTQSINIATK
ncbi:MAG: Plastocyanin [Bacilli bacterium]|nr:Plastocyanin [Bacilli bacterium]